MATKSKSEVVANEAEVTAPETSGAKQNESAAPGVTPPEMVDIFIERGGQNEDPNMYVGFNGKNYVLPRGKTSKVPKFVADEINRARAAQSHLDSTIDAMLENMQEKANTIK